jgi:hypothetical protein
MVMSRMREHCGHDAKTLASAREQVFLKLALTPLHTLRRVIANQGCSRGQA